MVQMSLTPDEAALLRELLENAIIDIRKESWHTDTRSFRELLKAREKALAQVLDRVSAVAA
jgi:hypothetical protein